MKKVVALLCVLFVLVPMCFAEETSDFSYFDGMSIEELIAARDEANSRLAQEGFYEANSIAPGKYVVGTDIKAGAYVVKHLYDQGLSDSRATIIVYESLEDANNNETPIDFQWLSVGSEQFIRLEDGQCLYNLNMTLYLFDAISDEVKKSWQP